MSNITQKQVIVGDDGAGSNVDVVQVSRDDSATTGGAATVAERQVITVGDPSYARGLQAVVPESGGDGAALTKDRTLAAIAEEILEEVRRIRERVEENL